MSACRKGEMHKSRLAGDKAVSHLSTEDRMTASRRVHVPL